MKELTQEAIQQVTQEKWQKCTNHVKQIEAQMVKLDGILDADEEFLINLESSSDSSSFEETSSETEAYMNSRSETEEYDFY